MPFPNKDAPEYTPKKESFPTSVDPDVDRFSSALDEAAVKREKDDDFSIKTTGSDDNYGKPKWELEEEEFKARMAQMEQEHKEKMAKMMGEETTGPRDADGFKSPFEAVRFNVAVENAVAKKLAEINADAAKAKEQEMQDFASMMAVAMKTALDVKDGATMTTSSRVRTPAPIVTVNGMDFAPTARSATEITQAKVSLSKADRSRMSPNDLEKTKTKVCAAMAQKFQQMDYAKLINAGSSETTGFGEMLLGQITTFEAFVTWCQSYDVASIFMMPMSGSFTDRAVVAAAPRLNLLEDLNYQKVSLDQVRTFQEFLATNLSDADVESSNWALEKLTNSIEANLLVSIKQRFDRLPEAQKGGVVLWKLLVDKLYADSYENKELLKTYLASTVSVIHPATMFLSRLPASLRQPALLIVVIFPPPSSRCISRACPTVQTTIARHSRQPSLLSWDLSRFKITLPLIR
jgi:hypothetical protein